MGIRMIKNNKLWLEGEAIQHLEQLSLLEGVEDVVGLPDLHQGKVPVGMTVKTKGLIYPYLIGNDIGCGMALFNTNIKTKKLNMNILLKRLENTQIKGKYSIGGGNHFVEIQVIDQVYNNPLAKKIYLDKKYIYLLVHSGSRNLGERIYRNYASLEPLLEKSQEMKHYLCQHQKAVGFAEMNRKQIADLFMDKTRLKYRNELILDCMHNYIEYYEGFYYHHKGSVSSWNDYAVIAGSRGTYSYVVRCIPKEETLYSLSHGAGRKWARYLCRSRLENKYRNIDCLKVTQMGGRVITDKKELLYEEASEVYKSIDDIIDVLLMYGCIELIARLKPVVTYKC